MSVRSQLRINKDKLPELKALSKKQLLNYILKNYAVKELDVLLLDHMLSVADERGWFRLAEEENLSPTITCGDGGTFGIIISQRSE